MPWNEAPLRTIQEGEQFRFEKTRITFGDRDADELYQMAVYWPLARQPESGYRTDRPGIWMIFFEPTPELSFAVYYQFNDETVLLLSIVPSNESYDPIYE